MSPESDRATARSAFYEEIAKWILPSTAAIALALGAVIGVRVMNQQDEMAKALATLQTDMAVLKVDISYIKVARSQ